MGASFSFEGIPSLEGKVAIITGASAGIGKICALEMARKGCHVVLACRSKDKTLPVIEEIKKQTHNEKVEFMELDLASLKSVEAFSKAYLDTGYPLHILLNNAAVMACPYSLSVDGIELQFATNHLGHFLLTTALLEVLERSAPSRVINVSSLGHKLAPSEGVYFDRLNDEGVYSAWGAYGQSKLCNILFANELTRRLGDKPIYCNSVHPGYVATELSRHMGDLYGGAGEFFSAIGSSLFAKTPESGALTSLYVATSPEIQEKEYKGRYFVPTAKLSEPSSQAKDETLAAKLWEFSENLIKEKLHDTRGEEKEVESEESDSTKEKEVESKEI